MSPFAIQGNFNSLARLEQIRALLKHGMLLHPCLPPDAKGCVDPGKTPRWSVERRLKSPAEERFAAFQGLGSRDNVGLVPRAPNVLLDVDDHSDPNHHGLRVFEVRHPEFYGDTLRHPTGDGIHIQLHCEDVPEGQEKIEIRNYLGCVNVEIFVGDGENVIIPPSVHENGTVYEFQGSQALSVKWVDLLRTFNYEPSDSQESKAGRRWKADSDWKSKFKGNLLTLDIFALADHHGLLGAERHETQEGYRCYTCRCPWRDEHTKNKTDEWSDRDTSCVLLSAPGYLPQFVCKHSHGDQYKLPEFLDWCEEQTPGSVDAHCAQRWHDWSDKSKARRTDAGEGDLRERGTDEPDGYFPAVDWAPKSNPTMAAACPYPKDSILQDYYDYSAPLTEGADCFIIGSALAVVAGLLARNVHVPFGDDVIFPNIYSMIVGPPGDRKSHTIKISERMAKRLLPHPAFLSKQSSAEAMFDEYAERPDKIHIVDDAAQLLATWISTQYGERASALFLQLYDCCPLDESFIRNRKQTAEKESRRYIEQTSTSVLYGATPLHAVFPQQKHQLGLSRRFLFYYSPVPGRFIPWPLETSIEPMVELFKPLLDLRGPIRLSPEAMELWIKFQEDNRRRKAEIPEERESEKYALSSEPVQVLKISTQFEACRAIKNREPFITEIRADTLECAIAHVGACLGSARTLVGLGKRHETRQQAEEILEKIRYSFAPDKIHLDTIYVSRSRLTRKLCHDTDRKGALQTDTLYLEIISYLIESLEAKRVFKQGKREVYAFRAAYSPRINPPASRTNPEGPNNDPPRENQENPPNSPNSAPPVTQTPKTPDFHENQDFCTQQDLGLEISASSTVTSYNHYNYESNAHKCARDTDLELFNENEGFCVNGTGGAENTEYGEFNQVAEEKPPSEGAGIEGKTAEMARNFVPGRSFETPNFVFSADLDHAQEQIRELNANPSTLISLDLETCKATGADELPARTREGFWKGKEALYPHLGEIRLLTVCVPGSRTVVFDLRRLGTDTLPWRSLFENRETIVHNGMFECKWIQAKLGFRLPKVFDTMHAAHTLQNGIDGQRNHLGLATIVKRYLGRTVSKAEQLSDFGVDVLTYEQIAYAAGDVDLLDLLRQELRRLLDSAEGGSLLPVFELDMRYLPILAEREGHGTRFDVSFGRALVTDATNTLARVERRLSELWGAEVLLSSPAQVKKALELLVGREITDTSADTLKILSADCEAAELMLEHRKAAAILTQTGGLLDFVHDDRRIYPSFNMGGTETGRILSTNPTLNNLSVDTGVRSCILPDQPGYVVVKNDFSREEPTIAAVEFGVKNLIDDILNGRDLYRGFTTSIFGIDYESVRPEQLAVGKANFLGVTYGEKVAGLIAAAAKEGRLLTEETARQIIDGFDLRYPELRDAWNQARRAAHKGLIRFGKSKLGRRRLLLRYREQPTQEFLNSGLRKAKVAFFGSVPSATKAEKLAHTDFPPEGKSASARAKNAARREAIMSARVKWAEWEKNVLPGVMDQIAEAWSRKEAWRESWAAQQLMINFRIQAGGSDVIRLSEILVDARLPEPCRTLLSNHDEIVVSCPREKVAEVTKILQESMHEAFSSLYPGVPIKSEPEVGETWK